MKLSELDTAQIKTISTPTATPTLKLSELNPSEFKVVQPTQPVVQPQPKTGFFDKIKTRIIEPIKSSISNLMSGNAGEQRKAQAGFQANTQTSQDANKLVEQAKLETDLVKKQQLLDHASKMLKGEPQVEIPKTGVFMKGLEQATKNREEFQSGDQSLKSRLSYDLRQFGASAKVVGSTIAEAFNVPIKIAGQTTLGKNLVSSTKDVLNLIREERAKSPLLEDVSGNFKNNLANLYDKWQGFKSEHPEAAANVEAGANIGAVLLFAKGVKEGLPIAKSKLANLEQGLTDLGNIVEGGTKEAVTAIGEGTIRGYDKLKNLFPGRSTEEVALNILQPTKGYAKNAKWLKDAEEGLSLITEELPTTKRLSTLFTETPVADGFKGLESQAGSTLNKIGTQIDSKLKLVVGNSEIGNKTINEALNSLSSIFEGQPGSEIAGARNKVLSWIEKNNKYGLSAEDQNQIKIMLTKWNNLFTEKGTMPGGISQDALRSLRRDLVSQINELAKNSNVKGLIELNDYWGKVADAKILIGEQVANRTAALGRAKSKNIISKIILKVSELPGIRDLVTNPAKTILSKLTNGKENISAAEIEQNLSKYLKELKRAGAKDDEIKAFLNESEKIINSEINVEAPRLMLPAPSYIEGMPYKGGQGGLIDPSILSNEEKAMKGLIPQEKIIEPRKGSGIIDSLQAKKVEGAIPETKTPLAQKIMETGEQKPTIKLKRDVTVTTLSGEKVMIPEDEVLKAYESGGKALLKDGREYVVSKSQYENIKNNSLKSEVKEFAPELKGTEETVKGNLPKIEFGEPQEIRGNVVWKQKNGNGAISERQSVINGGNEYLLEVDGEEVGWYSSFDEAVAEATGRKAEYLQDTKYSNYQLPGGKNYKEVLIKAPSNNNPTKALEIKNKAFADYDAGKITLEQRNMALDELNGVAGNDFISSHWSEPNVISHLRLNERTYQGKKVTFMEELQSDWAREARKVDNSVGATKAREEMRELTKIKNKTPEQIERWNYLQDNFDFIKNETPSNPLLKNWQEISIKRALKEAVDNNSEYFAWTTGEQQAARYNLAKQVENINWAKDSGGKMVTVKPIGSKEIMFRVGNDGNILDGHNVPSDWVGKKVSDAVGKGIGEKIIESETGNLSGEGLNIGGEWAKNLYDKQVKNIVEDLTGGKIEVIDMGLPVAKKTDEVMLAGFDKEMNFKPTENLLKIDDLKIGQPISIGGSRPEFITSVGKDGKFRAIDELVADNESQIYDFITKNKLDVDGEASLRDVISRAKGRTKIELFRKLDEFAKDMSLGIDKSVGQQAIKITPEIKALVKGEELKLEKPTSKLGDLLKKKPNTSETSLINEAKKYKSAEEFVNSQTQFTGKEIAREAKTLGSDQGGLSDFTLKQISSESYNTETIKIKELLKSDPDLANYVRSGEIRQFEGEPFAMDPVVSSKGEVIDGYNRIAQALKNGEENIKILKGVEKSQLTDIWNRANKPKGFLDQLNK